MSPEPQDPLIGTMLGKNYRVLEPIGAGGMAVVYLVEHQGLFKQFAAKVLSRNLATSLEARARFAQEAHAASQLDHENIVSISDFGVTVDHRPFFVMELLRGKTLDQRLAEGRMSIEEVVAVSVPVARALAHAHAEGIVHLDIKPENIFLVQRSQGRWGVKVVDFGIAKTPNNPRLTKIGETNGSPMFMAPEMCRGDDDVDRRADVYSFGILLYLMMCGRLPFVDDSLHRVLQMQLVQLPAPPRQVNTELSPELAAIVERSLAKHREDRYPSMEALLADLAAALPPGADRLLIEAQSGTAANDTPFAGALTIVRAEPPAEPPPEPRVTPPPMFHSMLPPAPTRRRPVIIATAALVTIVVGALMWRQLGVKSPSVHNQTASAGKPTPTFARANESGGHTQEAKPAATPSMPPTSPSTPVDETAPVADTPTNETPADVAANSEAASPAAPEGTPRRRADSPPPTRRGVRVATNRTPPRPPRPVPGSVTAPSRTPTASMMTSETPPPRAEPLTTLPDQTSEPTAEPSSPDKPKATPPTPAPVPLQPTPTPTPPVITPPAPPPAPPPPPAPGSLDAKLDVNLAVTGSLTRAHVKPGIDRNQDKLRACYREAARANQKTPALEMTIAFEVNEQGRATGVKVGGESFGSLAKCATAWANQIRTEVPDTGTAQVTLVIKFRPL